MQRNRAGDSCLRVPRKRREMFSGPGLAAGQPELPRERIAATVPLNWVFRYETSHASVPPTSCPGCWRFVRPAVLPHDVG